MKNTPEYIASRLRTGIDDTGCYTSDDFKSFAREFKCMIKAELKKVSATDLKQSNGHYILSGFFTLGNQPYYYSLSDVRYFPKPVLLVRECDNYKDYSGKINQYIPITTDMFKNFFKVSDLCIV